jgi:hypothetical protein
MGSRSAPIATVPPADFRNNIKVIEPTSAGVLVGRRSTGRPAAPSARDPKMPFTTTWRTTEIGGCRTYDIELLTSAASLGPGPRTKGESIEAFRQALIRCVICLTQENRVAMSSSGQGKEVPSAWIDAREASQNAKID